MKSNRLMSHAGALAVAIAIMALPGFTASAAAQAPPPAPVAADSVVHVDSTATPPVNPPVPAPSESPARMPADTSAAAPPQQLAPAPTSAPAPTTAPPSVSAPAPAPAPATTGVRDPWAKGTNWITVNFGYARSGEPGAAPAGYGFGVGIRRMLTRRWSAALNGGFDQLGRFDTAKEWEYPITVQLTRHFIWKTAARPYMEVGYGRFQHAYRGTANDVHKGLSGVLFAAGIDVPTGGRSLVGAYGRYEYLNNKQGPPNPVFDGERNFAVRYAIRLTWSILL